MRLFVAFCATCCAALFVADPALAQPIAPNFVVSVYATVEGPVRLAFAPDGTLYVGRDNQFSGGTGKEEQRIHRIGPGGSPVAEFGDPFADPDMVGFDVSGMISGTPGSVLVGGTQPLGNGAIAAIRPDATMVTIFDSPTMANPTALKFDSTGRMLMADFDLGEIQVSTGELPNPLFTVAGNPLNLALDADDRIYTAASQGTTFPITSTISIHDAAGTLVDAEFATGLGRFVALAVGPGGLWGTDLYVFSQGGFYRYHPDGSRTLIGAGFPVILLDAVFGPDGALYASDNPNNRIWRIEPVPEPSSFALGVCGAACMMLAAARFRRRNKAQQEQRAWMSRSSASPGCGESSAGR